MNLHQLRIFCAVVEEGSFRQAAEKLFLSQPSVSQHVASLEKDHSIRLFERKGRTISLTPEGRALYVLASDLLRQADEIPARFRDMQALRSGRLETGVSPFAGYYILPRPWPISVPLFRPSPCPFPRETPRKYSPISGAGKSSWSSLDETSPHPGNRT